MQCERDRMRCSDAWSDACVQCRVTPAEHWDNLTAQQLDLAELAEAPCLDCPVYATLCSHLPVGLVYLMRRGPLARGGRLPALAGPADGESVDGPELWVVVGQHERQHDGGGALRPVGWQGRAGSGCEARP